MNLHTHAHRISDPALWVAPFVQALMAGSRMFSNEARATASLKDAYDMIRGL